MTQYYTTVVAPKKGKSLVSDLYDENWDADCKDVVDDWDAIRHNDVDAILDIARDSDAALACIMHLRNRVADLEKQADEMKMQVDELKKRAAEQRELDSDLVEALEVQVVQERAEYPALEAAMEQAMQMLLGE